MARLSISAAEELAYWFLARMDTEARRRLMAERPQLYGEVFPDVDPDIIMARVQEAMTTRCTTCNRAAHTAGSTSYHGHPYTGPGTVEAAGHYHDPGGQYDYCADPLCSRVRRDA